MWKTAFKNLQFSNFKAFKFLKGCLPQIFYLVHSWLLCPISSCFPRLNPPPGSYHHLRSLPGRGKLLTPQAVFLQKSVLLSELVCLKGLRLSAIYINFTYYHKICYTPFCVYDIMKDTYLLFSYDIATVEYRRLKLSYNLQAFLQSHIPSMIIC